MKHSVKAVLGVLLLAGAVGCSTSTSDQIAQDAKANFEATVDALPETSYPNKDDPDSYIYKTSKSDSEAEYKIISVDTISTRESLASSDLRIFTVVHRKTRVMYTWITSNVYHGESVAVQMLVDAEGKPLLYEGGTTD